MFLEQTVFQDVKLEENRKLLEGDDINFGVKSAYIKWQFSVFVWP